MSPAVQRQTHTWNKVSTNRHEYQWPNGVTRERVLVQPMCSKSVIGVQKDRQPRTRQESSWSAQTAWWIQEIISQPTKAHQCPSSTRQEKLLEGLIQIQFRAHFERRLKLTNLTMRSGHECNEIKSRCKTFDEFDVNLVYFQVVSLCTFHSYMRHDQYLRIQREHVA